MRIKRVEAATVAEALRLLRAELGEHALILHTRTASAPGPFRAGRVEVMGAVDEPRGPVPPAAEVAVPRTVREAVALYRSARSDQGVGGLAQARVAPPAAAVAGRPVVAGPAVAGGGGEPFRYGRAGARARRIAFVGPTGAGKTTTLAKVAARAMLEHGQRVALITVDTYRLGAVPQLTSYAEILGIPLTVADTPQAVAAAMARARDADLVFIDTAGRSPLGPGVDGLRPFVEHAAPDDVCLVVGATTRPTDVRRAAASFARLGPNRLCITKLDETDDRRDIPALARETGLALTWLGTGQEVPDDLAEGDPARLEARLAGSAA
jgi:flagellar biosynthesis protein FlhF